MEKREGGEERGGGEGEEKAGLGTILICRYFGTAA
jgi:hypothetical protein